MRHVGSGLAALAAVGFGVGVLALPAPAEATVVSYLGLTNTSDTLVVGNATWSVSVACANLSGTVCSSLALMAGAGNNAVITGYTGSISSPTLVSIASVAGGAADFTVSLKQVMSSGTVSSASMFVNGGAGSDSAVVQSYDPNTLSYVDVNNSPSLSTVGTAPNPATISFNPVNNLQFAMDNNVTTGLVTITAGQPVPEPGSIGVLGVALLGLGAVYGPRRSQKA